MGASQTEVAGSAAHAQQRLIDMPAAMPIVTEMDGGLRDEERR